MSAAHSVELSGGMQAMDTATDHGMPGGVEVGDTTGTNRVPETALSLWTSSAAAMGTVVTLRVVGATDDAEPRDRAARAFGWFGHIEAICSRFDPQSEVMSLCQGIGRPVVVSEILFGLIEMALTIARRSRGAFDPTVGMALERAGFDRHYRTGERVRSAGAVEVQPTYRDVLLDRRRRSVTLRQPMILDLGAVAKGLAIDLAAKELEGYSGYAVEAGGDLFLGGCNEHGTPWVVGIRHPRIPGTLIDTLALSNMAVCTSGDYERRVDAGMITHHLLDPRTGASAVSTASATVLAPNAMLADGLATAAFVLGPRRGLALLAEAGVEGLIIAPQLQMKATPHYAQYRTVSATD